MICISVKTLIWTALILYNFCSLKNIYVLDDALKSSKAM
jgi:hypothetical protein